MKGKLDQLSYDIVTLLEEQQPDMLRNGEICGELWEKKEYRLKYKDKKVFISAVSQKLKRLEEEKNLKKTGSHYGTHKSHPPNTKVLHVGFFDWLERRDERKRAEDERYERELRCKTAINKATMLLKDDDHFLENALKIKLEMWKKFGLDDARENDNG